MANKCYVKGCDAPAVMTIAGTDIKFCKVHGAEYTASLVKLRNTAPGANQRGGHMFWQYALENAVFSPPGAKQPNPGAAINESPSGAPIGIGVN